MRTAIEFIEEAEHSGVHADGEPWGELAIAKAIIEQTAVMERQAAALERIADALIAPALTGSGLPQESIASLFRTFVMYGGSRT